MFTHFLKTLAEEVADYTESCIWSLFTSCAFLIEGGEGREGTGSGGVSLFTFHGTFPVNPAAAIRAPVHIASLTVRDQWQRKKVKSYSRIESLKSGFRDIIFSHFWLNNPRGSGVHPLWILYFHEDCLWKISMTVYYIWLNRVMKKPEHRGEVENIGK